MQLNRYQSLDPPQFNQYYNSYGKPQKLIGQNQYYQRISKPIQIKRSDISSRSKQKNIREKSNQPIKFEKVMHQFIERKQNYLRNRNSEEMVQSSLYSSPDFIFKLKLKMIQMSQTIRLSRTDILNMYDLTPQKALDFFMEKIREQLAYFARQSYSFRNEQQKLFKKSVQNYKQLHKSDYDIKNKLYRQNYCLKRQLSQKQNAVSILMNQLAVRTLQARKKGVKIEYEDKQTAIKDYQMIICKLEQRVKALSKFIDQNQSKRNHGNNGINRYQNKKKQQRQMQNIDLHNNQRELQMEILRNSIKAEVEVQTETKFRQQINKYEKKLFEKQQRIIQLQKNANIISRISEIQKRNYCQLPIQTNPYIIDTGLEQIEKASQIDHQYQETVFKNRVKQQQKKAYKMQQKQSYSQQESEEQQGSIQKLIQSKRDIISINKIIIRKRSKNSQDQKLFTDQNFSFSPSRKEKMDDDSSILNDSFKIEATVQKLFKENKRLYQENQRLNKQLKQWKQDFLKKFQELKENENQKSIKQKSKIRYSVKNSSEGDSQKLIKLSKQWKQKLQEAAADYEDQIKKLQIEVKIKHAQNNSLKNQFDILTSKIRSERQKQHGHTVNLSLDRKFTQLGQLGIKKSDKEEQQ